MTELTDEGTSAYLQTSDWRLHYNTAGSGHPVILLHGSGPGTTGWVNFKANLAALAQHFRVFAVDLPGWGRSDACTVDRLDHVETTRQFMAALGLERAALVGNSMGGVTALRFATVHPDLISHLITMGPVASLGPKLFGPGDGPTEGLKLLAEGYRDPSPTTMRRLVEVMTFAGRLASDALAQERSDAALARPDHLRNYLDGLPHGGPMTKWFSYEQLQSAPTPALLIHGRDDRVVPYEHSLHLLAHLPNSRLVLFNRCGHWAQLEHADEFNRIVIDFVAHT